MRLQLLTFWNTIDTHDDFIMHFMIHFYQFNLLFKKKMGGGGTRNCVSTISAFFETRFTPVGGATAGPAQIPAAATTRTAKRGTH